MEKLLHDCGPVSSPILSAGMASARQPHTVSPLREGICSKDIHRKHDLDTFFCAVSKKFFAWGTISSSSKMYLSHSGALRKVKTIPPPMIRRSALSEEIGEMTPSLSGDFRTAKDYK